jgi:hypothetical protein
MKDEPSVWVLAYVPGKGFFWTEVLIKEPK